MRAKKPKLNEIEKIIEGADFGRVPEKSYGTWYKKSLRRKLRALVRKAYWVSRQDGAIGFEKEFGMKL